MVKLTRTQVRERMIALFLVFFVAMFFWMSFHQNGAAMTAFARDYTVDSVGRFTNIWFDLFGLLPIFLSLLGLIFMIRKKSTGSQKLIGLIAFVGFAIIAYLRISGYSDSNDFTPQKFQHFNPFFIVALTPLVVGFFTWLASRDSEPSAPKKIGIGMIITSVGFTVMIIGSLSLMGYSPGDIGEIRAPSDRLVGPAKLVHTVDSSVLAHHHLFHTDHSGIVPQSHGIILYLQGLTTAVQGYDAGCMACRHSHRKLRRGPGRDLLEQGTVMGVLEHTCSCLFPGCVLYLLHIEKARESYGIIVSGNSDKFLRVGIIFSRLLFWGYTDALGSGRRWYN